MGSDESKEAKQESQKVKETSELPSTSEEVPKAAMNAAGSEETKAEDTKQAAPEPEDEDATPTEKSNLAEPADSRAQQGSEGIVQDNLDSAFSNTRIQRILDIEMPVNVSFGSAKRPLSEVLKMGPGALLELDRLADEPVLLKVNNKVFAKGEIVDIDGYYGVQITEIVSPVQRIASLGGSK